MTVRLTPAQVRKLTHRAKASALEDGLAARIRAEGLPAPLRDLRFCSRRWRFDFAWPDRMLALEVEGGTYSRGRHTRPEGFERDCEKYAEATIRGWRDRKSVV